MFLNLSKDVLGIGPEDGEVFQESSFGKREVRGPFALGRFRKKCVNLEPGAPHVAFDSRGPGLITRIWVTLPFFLYPHALRDIVLRMQWDEEDEPSVLVPLGDLFGATFAKVEDYRSAYLSITSGALICFFPMPFQKRALITFENQGRVTIRFFFYQITYMKLERSFAEGTPYFHSMWRMERLGRDDPSFTVLDARGRGFYLGCHVNMQGRGIPWRLNPLNTAFPEGWGLGMLEGWERIWIDGSENPHIHGTGGEDYFNGAWYFTRVPSCGLSHGVTRRSYVTRRVSCYRFHIEMPVYFNSSFIMTLDHGFENSLPAIYDSTAFWYQNEPHLRMGDLPAPLARHPSGGALNAVVMGTPFFAAATIARIRKYRRFSVSGG